MDVLTKILNFLRPSLTKVLILCMLILVTMFVIVHREATSKVLWEQLRGVPYPFLVLTEYRGPCPPDNAFCVEVYFQKVYPIGILGDIFIWYLVTCVITKTFEKVTDWYGAKGLNEKSI